MITFIFQTDHIRQQCYCLVVIRPFCAALLFEFEVLQVNLSFSLHNHCCYHISFFSRQSVYPEGSFTNQPGLQHPFREAIPSHLNTHTHTHTHIYIYLCDTLPSGPEILIDLRFGKMHGGGGDWRDQHLEKVHSFKEWRVGALPWWSTGLESTLQCRGREFDPCVEN